MKQKKVSFDFDSTLSRKDVQNFAKEIIANGAEVWIVTTRTSTEDIVARNWTWCLNQNEIVFKVARMWNTKRKNCFYRSYR